MKWQLTTAFALALAAFVYDADDKAISWYKLAALNYGGKLALVHALRPPPPPPPPPPPDTISTVILSF